MSNFSCFNKDFFLNIKKILLINFSFSFQFFSSNLVKFLPHSEPLGCISREYFPRLTKPSTYSVVFFVSMCRTLEWSFYFLLFISFYSLLLLEAEKSHSSPGRDWDTKGVYLSSPPPLLVSPCTQKGERHQSVQHGRRHRPDDDSIGYIRSGRWRLPYAVRWVSAA